jgi:branched-chain amino acid transport system substrate-binding protein
MVTEGAEGTVSRRDPARARPRWGALALVGCLAFPCAGCGDADSEPRGGQINIGVLMPLTAGLLSSQAPGWEAAAKVAQTEINQAGGVLDSHVHLDMRDSQSDTGETAPPYTSDLVAQQLLAVGERLWVFSDGGNTPDHMAATAQAGGALVIFTVVGGDSVTTLDTTDMFFRTCGRAADNGKATAYYAYSQGNRRVATIASPVMVASTAVPFANYFATLGGSVIPFTGERGAVSYLLGPDPVAYSGYDADVQLVMAENPDAIFVAAALDPTGAGYLQALLNANYPGQIYIDGMMADTTLFTKVKGNTNGIRGVMPGDPVARKALAQKVEVGSGTSLSTVSRLAENYDAIYLMVLAIAHAGSTDPVAVRDGLRAVSGPGGATVGPGDFGLALQLIAAGQSVNYQGVSGGLDFDLDGNVTSLFDLWVTHDRTFESVGTWTPTGH